MNKQPKNNDLHLIKIFAIAGLIVISIGIVANLFSAYTNQRFMNDQFDLIYYFRIIILLGGGFAVGYLLAKRTSTLSRYEKLFTGVCYAALAVMLSWVFDIIRLGIQNTFDDLQYPWGKVLFLGTPALALIATSIIAYVSQRRTDRSTVSRFTKYLLVISFMSAELYQVTTSIYWLVSGSATFGPATSVWTILASYATTPLVIVLLAYVFFTAIAARINRLFYAVLAGILYSTLSMVLWEFRVDPTADSTNAFAMIVMSVTIIYAGVLIWQARRALKK